MVTARKASISELREAFVSGRWCYAQGLNLDDCPYRRMVFVEQWYKGWRAADGERTMVTA